MRPQLSKTLQRQGRVGFDVRCGGSVLPRDQVLESDISCGTRVGGIENRKHVHAGQFRMVRNLEDRVDGAELGHKACRVGVRETVPCQYRTRICLPCM